MRVILIQQNYFSWALDEEAVSSYSFIKDLMKTFNGNGGKFYPDFYDIVCPKTLFPTLNKKCLKIIGVKVVNHILSYQNVKLYSYCC